MDGDEANRTPALGPVGTTETSVRAIVLCGMLSSARLARVGFETLVCTVRPEDAGWSSEMTPGEFENASAVRAELDRMVPLLLDLRLRFGILLDKAARPSAVPPGGLQ